MAKYIKKNINNDIAILQNNKQNKKIKHFVQTGTDQIQSLCAWDVTYIFHWYDFYWIESNL